MRWSVVFLVVLVGCADAPQQVTEGLDEVEPGVLRCVVVDAAIIPIPDVTVTLETDPPTTSTTDSEGRCEFPGLDEGLYTLTAKHPLYHPTTTVATLTAEGGMARIQVERLFSQDPITEQTHLRGYMNCGYSAGLSAPCILDYTQLLPVCPGGCLPQLYGITGDVRRFVVPIDAGWQSMITEMTWRPNIGTSEAMQMTASFYNRTSSHSYTGAAGTSPVRLQMDMDGREHPDWVGPDGQHDFLLFVNPSTSGSGLPVAVMVEQRFDLYIHEFYYGMPPEGWSFVAGDEPPF